MAGGARGRVLRTQSEGAAAAEKIPAAADKSASAAEKVAGEEKRREWGGLGNRLLRSNPLHSSKSAVREHRESPKGFATRLRVFAGMWSCFSPG